jgi:nucleotide-binding universal stress UspA family protein
MIVVGIDGSEGSARALRFAAEEAQVHDQPLHIVAAWQVQVPLYAGGLVAPPPVLPDDLEQATRKEATQQVADILEGHAGVPHDVVVRQGSAAAVLVAESQGAEMLVVGSRGRGGFTGLLLGSVSQQAAHHATCPVVIVPPADRA